MRLQEFRILNYRSINDSGWVKCERITPLVGRNESGKTNLLLALYHLKPADMPMSAFSKAKDFPRDRHLSEFQDALLVVQTRWVLEDSEKQAFREKFQIESEIETVFVDRAYSASYNISLAPLTEQTYLRKSEDGSEKNLKPDVDKWIISILPHFMYLADYPEIDGHANIDEYLNRKKSGQSTEADRYFDKLMTVSGLNPEELKNLLSQTPELRQQLTNRAGAVVTSKIRELWKDRPLKVRFNLDGGHFDTLLSDPNASYDVEVNFNERSRGFKWFFSFYITFAADTKEGKAANAILLLDEPGLYLHAVAQRDLLNHFRKDFSNQILYTTHSPFMVPLDSISGIRTVNIRPEAGTEVNNDPQGDEKTLFPLQAALGYDITQTLFVGTTTLVVEGVTDFWYLWCLSQAFRDAGKKGLDREVVITPAGGAAKITYLVSLLASQNMKLVTLLDAERTAWHAAEEMIKSKLIRSDSVIFVNEVEPGRQEMDIEDLLDGSIFGDLVQEAYAKELKGQNLQLNLSIPRIVPRYEAAFEAVGLEFHKTRIAKLFIQRIPTAYSTIVNSDTEKRFETLFEIVNRRFLKLRAVDRDPFL